MLDENTQAEGHDYFAVGTAVVSPDHAWLAYATDTEGAEHYQLRFRALEGRGGSDKVDDGATPEVVADVGYGLAWSSDATVVFYVRFDDAQRPHQLWRHRLRTHPARDVLVLEETDRRFSLGTGRTRDGAFVLVGLHSTNTTEWLAIPADEPAAEPRVIMPRREGIEYSVDHLSRAGDAGPGWVPILTNNEAQDFRVLARPDDPADGNDGTDEEDTWREIVPLRSGVRIEDVDAFATVIVLSERAEAETVVRVLPLGTGGDPLDGDLLRGAGWSLPPSGPRRSGWAPTPSRTSPRSTSADIDGLTQQCVADRSGSRGEIVLKTEPVLGDFDPANYTTFLTWAEAGDGRGCRSRWCIARASPCPPPVSSTATGRIISIDPSFSTIGSPSSTAAWSTRWPTCGAAVSLVEPGTTAAAWSTRPTPSATSSPAPTTSLTKTWPRPGPWQAAPRRAGCSSALWPTPRRSLRRSGGPGPLRRLREHHARRRTPPHRR